MPDAHVWVEQVAADARGYGEWIMRCARCPHLWRDRYSCEHVAVEVARTHYRSGLQPHGDGVTGPLAGTSPDGAAVIR